MKIKIAYLSIELTRRCNYKCAHCCKGDAQTVDLRNRHIEKLFGMIDEIYTLHITGGEPSLNLDGMRCMIDTIKRENIIIHKLDTIVNGATKTTAEFFDMLDEINRFVLKPQDTRVTISCDPYHSSTGKVSLGNLIRGYDIVQKLDKCAYSFRVLPYFTCNYPPLVAMGRGENIQKFADPQNPDKYGILYNHPVTVHDRILGAIGVHATGMIGRDLNISYADAEKPENHICNIDDISNEYELVEAVRRWNEQPDVKIRGALFEIAQKIYSPLCKQCQNYQNIHDKQLVFAKQILESDFIQDYPKKFTDSKFIDILRNETKNVSLDDCESVTFEDATGCEWWNFED